MEKLVEDIHLFFPEFLIHLNDLKNPTASFVRDFFCKILIELGVDMSNVRKMQMDQLDMEMDILPELNLVTAIRTALPSLNFRLNDIIAPEIKRNFNLMSQSMDFMQFCESRCAEINNQMEEIQTARLKEIELEKIRDKESTLLSNLALEVDSHKQMKERLESDIAKLQNDIYTYKEDKNSILEPVREIQELLHAKENKINNLEREIQMISTENDELKKLIVNDPDKEQRELEVKSRDRERVLERKKEYQSKLKSLNEDKERLQKHVELLTKKVEPILQELHFLQKYSEYKETNEKATESVKDLQNKKEELLKSIDEIEKKFHNEEKNALKRIAELEKEEELVKEELEAKKSEYKVKSKEVKHVQMTRKEELDKVLNHISKIDDDFNTLLSQYNKNKEMLFSMIK